jgi:hypothetical protein
MEALRHSSKRPAMNDPQRAFVTAAMATAMFALAIWTPIRAVLRPHMRYFVSGPLNLMHPKGISTMTGSLILIAGLFLVFFVPSVVLWQAVNLRRAGLIMKRAHGEVQRGMPGMEGLRKRVQ